MDWLEAALQPLDLRELRWAMGALEIALDRHRRTACETVSPAGRSLSLPEAYAEAIRTLLEVVRREGEVSVLPLVHACRAFIACCRRHVREEERRFPAAVKAATFRPEGGEFQGLL
ncbi:MAG TPA: hypothetical protein VNO22_01730 [Planctomycetota bacterium]|nr:hypothetical protein [Planctomycetota bacterium]